ncbi:MAG: alpha/beta fold hydrolase [Pararhodobacter sp.]
MTQGDALQFDIGGSGAPVVMVHGLGGTSNSFQAMMPHLGAFAVCRPDMPGAGRSPLPQGALTLDTMVAALGRFLDAQGLTRVSLVGHSLGTLVCQHFARKTPDRVQAMVLIGALTEPPGPARDGLKARAAVARQAGMAGIADDIVARTLAPSALDSNPVIGAFLRETIMRQSPEGYARNCEALAAANRADAAQIPAPTLLITGDSDPVSPPGMAHELADRMPRATSEILLQCGHWAPIERSAECGRLAADFLARNTG